MRTRCSNFGNNLKCNYEDKCKYAHGQAEIRDELSNLEYLSNLKYMPKPCLKYLVSGYCYFGFQCKFLHGEIKEKTELCRYYEKNSFAKNTIRILDTGYKYGSKCMFLHGEIKEKNKELHNKYPHLSNLKF